MGIRFYCPNGHRLNVKDFLAGKRGICPHCAARFRIPLESEIPAGSPRTRPGSVSAGAGDAADDVAGRNGQSPPVAVGLSAQDDGPEDIEITISSPDADPATGSADYHATDSPAPDSIAEAPDAVWYVRPPAGGQYGPAKGDILRRWIAEGRVSADSLVWREGWADWQLAGPVFPELGSAYTTPAQDTAAKREPLPVPQDGRNQLAPGAVSPRRTHRPPANRKPIIAIVILTVLIVVLAVGLVVVLAAKRT